MRKKVIDLNARATIAVTEDILVDLRCLAQYKEPMADVIRRLITSYAGVAHINLEEKRRILLNGRKTA